MPTFTGTIGDDSLVGGAGNDSLEGLAGNDTLRGGAGDDTMNGDVGDDIYVVDSVGDVVVEAYFGGTDKIQSSVLDSLGEFSLLAFAYVENLTFTGTAAATLRGNSLANLISANSATTVSDTLYGAAGDDTLRGYGGNDTLIGGAGSDSLDGGVGNDMMIGGTGNDTYAVAQLTDRVFEYRNGGFDTIVSSVLKDLRLFWTGQVEGLTYNGAAAAVLHGNKLGNAITSLSASNDTLNGYEGNDSLDGGGGTDSLSGGIGDDFYFVGATDIVVEAENEGTDSVVGMWTSINAGAVAAAHAKFSATAVGAAFTLENLFYTGAAGATVTGNDMRNIVSGGAGNDVVQGLDESDSLAGGAGADSLEGGDGNDQLYGGSLLSYSYTGGSSGDTAIDTLAGGNGNDLYWIDNLIDLVNELVAGGTLDVVYTSIDNALSRYANVEAMVAREGSEAWMLRGSAGNDILVGNSGDNLLSGGAGNDTLSGNAEYAGNYYAFGSDVLEGGIGNDVLVAFAFGGYGYYQDATLFGGAGNDIYALGAGNLSGSDLGYGGQDTGGVDTAVLFGSASIEALEGVDNIVLFGAGGAAETQARDALDSVWAATHGGALYPYAIPTVLIGIGNALDNAISGNASNNQLSGLDGDDTITAGAGDDSLDGGAGIDSLVGGPGNDWLYAESGDAVVEDPASGFDILASNTLTSVAAFANVEGLQYLGSNDVNLNNGLDNVTNDFFGGGSGDDNVLGYGGNDTLGGGAGNDSVDGGAGLDTLNGGDGVDTVAGGDANDSMAGGAGNDAMLGGAGNDTVLGDDGNDNADGGDDNDYVYGGLGTDTVSGGPGNDQLWGGTGSYYVVDSGSNTLNGGAGNDLLYGDTFADLLTGGDENDTLVGGNGADILNGNAQANPAAYYSSGGDLLWGNAQYGNGSTDADQFRIDAPTAANQADETFVGSGQFYFNTGTLIADFVSGSDTIRFAKSMVGDNDLALENVAVQDAPGAFANAAEMVIFRTDVAATFNSGYYGLSYFAASAVTSVIGSAAAAFAAGAERLFVVDNGTSSAIFQFTSANADALVTQDELSLLCVVNADATLMASDILLF